MKITDRRAFLSFQRAPQRAPPPSAGRTSPPVQCSSKRAQWARSISATWAKRRRFSRRPSTRRSPTSPTRPSSEAVLVPAQSSVKTVADLRGKRIALNKGSNVQYFLVKLLRQHGLQYRDA